MLEVCLANTMLSRAVDQNATDAVPLPVAGSPDASSPVCDLVSRVPRDTEAGVFSSLPLLAPCYFLPRSDSLKPAPSIAVNSFFGGFLFFSSREAKCSRQEHHTGSQAPFSATQHLSSLY